MNFLAKLFGRADNKSEQKPVEEKSQEKKSIQQERRQKFQKDQQSENFVATIHKKIKQIEWYERNFEERVNILKEKGCEFLSKGQKIEARKFLTEATHYNQQLKNLYSAKKDLIDMLYELEFAADINAEAARVLEETKNFLTNILIRISQNNRKKSFAKKISMKLKIAMESKLRMQLIRESQILFEQIMAKMKKIMDTMKRQKIQLKMGSLQQKGLELFSSGNERKGRQHLTEFIRL